MRETVTVCCGWVVGLLIIFIMEEYKVVLKEAKIEMNSMFRSELDAFLFDIPYKNYNTQNSFVIAVEDYQNRFSNKASNLITRIINRYVSKVPKVRLETFVIDLNKHYSEWQKEALKEILFRLSRNNSF
jgi:hypothetical protein